MSIFPTLLQQEGAFFLTVAGTTRICSNRLIVSSDKVTPSRLQWHRFELIKILDKLGIDTRDKITKTHYTRQCLGKYIERELRKETGPTDLIGPSVDVWFNIYHTDVTTTRPTEEEMRTSHQIPLTTSSPQCLPLEKAERIQLEEVPAPKSPGHKETVEKLEITRSGLVGGDSNGCLNIVLTILLMNNPSNSFRTPFEAHIRRWLPGDEESKTEDITEFKHLLLLLLTHFDREANTHTITDDESMTLTCIAGRTDTPLEIMNKLCEYLHITPTVDRGGNLTIQVRDEPILKIHKSITPLLTKSNSLDFFAIMTHQHNDELQSSQYTGYYMWETDWYRYDSKKGTSVKIGEESQLIAALVKPGTVDYTYFQCIPA
jgi:hypothetical protein